MPIDEEQSMFAVSFDSPPSPEQARSALALVRRAEEDAYRPTPLPVATMAGAAAIAGLVVAAGDAGDWPAVGAAVAVGAVAVTTRRRWGNGSATVRVRSVPRALWAAALLPSACAGLAAAVALALTDSLDVPDHWLVRAGIGVAFAVSAAVAGKRFYRRAYQRWQRSARYPETGTLRRWGPGRPTPSTGVEG